MSRGLKKVIFSIFLVILPFTLFSQNALTTRYLTNATEKYNSGDYARAYDYVNYVLDSYGSTGLPSNVEELAEKIYYSYLNVLKTSFNASVFNKIKERLVSFTTLNTQRVQQVIKVISVQQGVSATANSSSGSSSSSSGSSSSSSGSSNYYSSSNSYNSNTDVSSGITSKQLSKILSAETKKQQTYIDTIVQQQKEAAELQKQELEEQKKAYQEAIKATSETITSSNKFLFYVILLIGVVFVIILLIMIIVNHVSSKRSQQQFNSTLMAVARMVGVSDREVYPAIPMYEANYQLLDTPNKGLGLPPPIMTDEDVSLVKELTRKCELIGAEIDLATARKNNSKNVAEISYKVCIALGMNSSDAMLLYATCLVYDIGFLSINRDLFKAAKLTDEEASKIRDHVKEGLSKLDFVPEKFYSTFVDATLNHHENFDGSGYPSGLSGDDIPFVARLIRITESYVALISKRIYRSIVDREAAIKELYSHSGMYDDVILKALDRVI